MAKIVCVHGIANTYLGSAQLTEAWTRALQGGLDEAGGPVLVSGDVDVVAYGALFRLDAEGNERRPTRSAPALSPLNLEADWEFDLIEKWWRIASELSTESRSAGGNDPEAEDPMIQPPEFAGRARTPQVVQRALIQLAKSRFLRPIAPALLISELRQVRLFLHDSNIRESILRRFEAKVGPETRVVVGHSLGSVVAYEALCANPGWQIHTFVTLGSPLGIPNVIYDHLGGRAAGSQAQRPSVQYWANIADKGDLVALVKELAPLFGDVEDTLVYNGWRSHEVERYLTAVETGRVVARALRP